MHEQFTGMTNLLHMKVKYSHLGERNFTILVEGFLVYKTWSKYYRYAEVKIFFFKWSHFYHFGSALLQRTLKNHTI